MVAVGRTNDNPWEHPARITTNLKKRDGWKLE